MKDAGWLPQISSFFSVLISLTALTLTGLTYRDRRKQDRRDLFLKLHERLVEPDVQRGRRLLFTEATTVEAVRELREQQPEIFDQINRAIAMLDIAGMYVARGYIDKDDFLSEWSGVYGRAWLASQPFLEVRLGGIRAGRNPGWPHFRALGAEAAELLEPVTPPPTTDGS